MIRFLFSLFKDCLQKVVVHHSTRIRCVGKQACTYSHATRNIPENALFIFEKELFCATFGSNRFQYWRRWCCEHFESTQNKHFTQITLFFGCVVLFKHLSHTTGNHIGASSAESISIALQSNTSLTSLYIRCVLLC